MRLWCVTRKGVVGFVEKGRRVLQNRAANAFDDDAAALVVKLEAERHELVDR